MSVYILSIVFLSSILLSVILTAKVRSYTLNKNILDIPNERSSHTLATPRGGGLSIVITLLFSAIVLMILLPSPNLLSATLIIPFVAYGILGWQDDKHNLSAKLRFLIQITIAFLFIIAYIVQLGTYSSWSPVAWISFLFIGTFWIVWMANLYNFMDGIDGISGIESISISAFAACWFYLAGAEAMAVLCISMAGASLGFLYWNWSPAKIFMGDVGSLALGSFFAIIAIIGTISFEIPVAAFLILYAVYLLDAGITLLHRIIKNEKWWQAHRSHYYQRAVLSGYTHKQVSIAVLLINLILGVIASFLIVGKISSVTGLFAGMIILAPVMFLINSRYNHSVQN